MRIGKLAAISGFLITLSAIISSNTTTVAAASIEVPRISIERAKQIHDDPEVIFIDVRSAKSWWRSTTKISRAVRENPAAVERWAPKYPRNKTLIFYCT